MFFLLKVNIIFLFEPYKGSKVPIELINSFVLKIKFLFSLELKLLLELLTIEDLESINFKVAIHFFSKAVKFL